MNLTLECEREEDGRWLAEVPRVGKTKLLKVILVGIGALITACFGMGNDRPLPEPA